MYLSSRPPSPEGADTGAPRRGLRGAGRNVILLGTTSLFTDLSSEMVTAVLPVYLTAQLGLTPLQFGAFDGVYQALTAVLGLAGAVAADRWRRHKEVATAGYGLSAACRLGMLAASGSWGPTVGVLYADRLGKGLRTAPRDALISLSAVPARMAEAFGVHRAFDTFGALLGPVTAFLLLRLVPGGYDSVFVVSFCAALVGLGVLTLFVENPPGQGRAEGSAPLRPTASSVVALVRMPPFRAVLAAAFVVSLVTLSDAFLYLTYQRRSGLATAAFPLLYAGSAVVYLVLAVPAGRLADRTGRVPVFLAGHLAMTAAYGVLLVDSSGALPSLALVALVGSYYAATAGVLMAVAGSVVPVELRTVGLALVVSCIALARMVSSLSFGAVWGAQGSGVAVAAFAVGMVVCVGVAGVVLRSAVPAPER